MVEYASNCRQKVQTCMKLLRIVLIKPSKYDVNGFVERFNKGFMPNATLNHIASLTPKIINDFDIKVYMVDEYVWCNLDYLKLFELDENYATLIAFVGVQTHQFQRALDLAAYAKSQGNNHCVIGGPHVMTCDTSLLQNRGVSFAISEAENVWIEIISDSIQGQLKPLYGLEGRWAPKLKNTIIDPPSSEELRRYWAPMLGIYPVRGCPYNCNFCSVIKISGRQVRSESIDSTMKSLISAKNAGIDTIMFVSDNFNKYPDVEILLKEIVKANLGIRYFCQCDSQIADQPDFIELLGRSNCFEVFVGVESFDRATLKGVNKYHNHPNKYADIVNTCDEFGIRSHFSNIIGFPNQTVQDINEHIDLLKQLKPKVASFFILTPIPGTDQYDEFQKIGLINETNLDRFDATYPTFQHCFLSKDQLLEKLFECYIQYNRFLLRNVRIDDETKRLAIFNRFTAENQMHPMAGGIGRVVIDNVENYLPVRRQYFDVDLAPLPNSLRLLDADTKLNRSAKL